MRHVSSTETPSLFAPELLSGVDFQDDHTTDAKGPEYLARDFVRWCWGFEGGFRNSPDITNLRFWLHRNRIEIADGEELAILGEARKVFLRKMEQATRKADVSQGTD